MRPDSGMSGKGGEEIKPSPPVTESRGEAERVYDHLARLKQVRPDKERPHDRRLTSLAPFIALTIGIVLVLGGVLWIIGTPDEIQFAGVEAYYRNNLEAGKLFVLRGRVVIPPALSGKGRIRVHASVLNDKKGIVAERTTPAGVMIPDEVLGYRNRDSIEEALYRAGNPEGLTAGPTPDGTIPFMVVFFNVTDTVTSYKLTAHRED